MTETFPSTHNQPPLNELLTEETIPFVKRAEDLIAAAGRATVSDDDTAGKAVLLARMLKDHTKAINEARETRKKPFLESGKMVDAHFKAIEGPLLRAAEAVVALLDTFRRQKEQEAAAERRRLEETARKEREEADRLAAKADSISDEIAATQAQERAQVTAQRAVETVAAPIASEYGFKASGRTIWLNEIVDTKAAMKHAMKIDPQAFTDCLAQVVANYTKSATKPVPPTEILSFPGARIFPDSKTVIR